MIPLEDYPMEPEAGENERPHRRDAKDAEKK